jgi:AcrR family transcriptional regulator
MVPERVDRLGECCGERPSRRERKKLEVLTRIRAAALELFNEKGYDATTVEEIAERADVAKATFFNYFPRKDTLLLALSEDMFGELLEELGPSEEWRGTAREQFQRLYLRLAEAVEQNPDAVAGDADREHAELLAAGVGGSGGTRVSRSQPAHSRSSAFAG